MRVKNQFGQRRRKRKSISPLAQLDEKKRDLKPADILGASLLGVFFAALVVGIVDDGAAAQNIYGVICSVLDIPVDFGRNWHLRTSL